MSKEKNKNETLSNELTEKENRLKKQYGRITKMTFEIDNRQMIAYVRKPKLHEMDATLNSLTSAPISSSVGLFKTCFVEGDNELLDMSSEDAGIALAIHKEIQAIIPIVVGNSITL